MGVITALAVGDASTSSWRPNASTRSGSSRSTPHAQPDMAGCIGNEVSSRQAPIPWGADAKPSGVLGVEANHGMEPDRCTVLFSATLAYWTVASSWTRVAAMPRSFAIARRSAMVKRPHKFGDPPLPDRLGGVVVAVEARGLVPTGGRRRCGGRCRFLVGHADTPLGPWVVG